MVPTFCFGSVLVQIKLHYFKKTKTKPKKNKTTSPLSNPLLIAQNTSSIFADTTFPTSSLLVQPSVHNGDPFHI